MLTTFAATDGLIYETPYFAFARQKIVDAFRKYTDAFPDANIHYAMKANSEDEVLRVLAGVGCGFEVASLGELQLLQALNVPPAKMIYGTSVKPASHIAAFFKYGVDRFAFDEYSELEKIATHAPGSKVYVRVSVNDETSVFKFSEKFGTGIDTVVPLLTYAKELGLQPYGISFNVGSQSSNPHAWAFGLQGLHEPMKQLQTIGIKLEAINIGGGFPCKYVSAENSCDLHEIARHTLAAFNSLPYQPKLLLEPGRGIIAETAILVATVIARIKRKNATWLFLDAGVYNGLFEAMAYQGSTRYRISKIGDTSGEHATFSIAGPTGDSPDILMRDASLPANIAVGDKLIIHDVGAYSIAVTSQFNGFPKPSVHFI